MKKALNILETNGFKPQGFRYYKEILNVLKEYVDIDKSKRLYLSKNNWSFAFSHS